MILVICIAAFVIIAVGYVVFLLFLQRALLQALFFAFGVVLTSALNVLKVYMLERTVQNTLEIDDVSTGKNYVRLQYLLRYALTGAVLLVAGLIWINVDPPFINIWGAIAGIFTLQISVIVVRSMKIENDSQS